MSVIVSYYYFSGNQKWDLNPGLFGSCRFIFPILLYTQQSQLLEASAQSFKNIYFLVWLQQVLAAAWDLLIAACGIWFPDRGSNLGPLYGRVGS